MDPSACRVIYIDSRFPSERWLSREALQSSQRTSSIEEFELLPSDLQANISAFLLVFSQVYVCRFGRSFSAKLSEIHESVQADCTPILACFDVGSQSASQQSAAVRGRRFDPDSNSPLPSPNTLRRELTFSSENDESYGLQLLSRIAADLQVDEGVKLIIPVAIVKPQRKDSYDNNLVEQQRQNTQGITTAAADNTGDTINPEMMLKCLDAGALDVVKSPLDKAGIMGLTVHAYRIFKSARADQAHFMASARRGRKQSWVGMDEEKPYAYLREAMVRKLLKGICEPEKAIEDFQHRDAYVDPSREEIVADAVGKWSFSAQDFTEDELVYAGYFMLNHALTMPEVSSYKQSKEELLRFMQGCRVAYNSFVLYHNFKHAVDVLQSTFYFLIQLGVLPPYPVGAAPAKLANEKSPVAKLLGPFEALTLIISAIGHDVGHPGVNNMFLVKLNAPLAQLYNDTSVLEAFHCAAYSQILRRHWPTAFRDKAIRKLMISSILATDMGCHSDYMQQLGNLQSKIHESKTTDSWTPKEIEQFRVLTCGLLIKCADISNVARPWAVAEKWTYKLQEEFAHQGEMEQNIGMETTLFGGPPEIGNMLKLANGQIGFMTIFAHPLFANVTDVIPAMGFAAEEILTNKGVWFTRAEHEKQVKMLEKQGGTRDGGVSPRSQSPTGMPKRYPLPSSPLRDRLQAHQDRSKSTDTGKSESLKDARGLVSPTTQANARKLPGEPTLLELGPGHGQGSGLSNGAAVPGDGSSTARLIDAEELPENQGEHGIHDKSRDKSESMRAGASDLPIEMMKHPPGVDSPNEEPAAQMNSFTFATSDVNEPVRTYDPTESHAVTNFDSRASAPMLDLTHVQEVSDMAGSHVKLQTSNSDPAALAAVHDLSDNQEDNQLTPTASTNALSFVTSTTTTTTDDNDDNNESTTSPSTSHSPTTPRTRAVSVPSANAAGLLEPSYSLNSDSTSNTPTDITSRSSSTKQQVRTAVISNANGDSTSDETRDGSRPGYKDRKMSTKSVGRKRSKLKMGNLAFWKKKSNDGSVAEESSAG